MAGPCDFPVDEIVCENTKPGNPSSEWDLEGAGDPTIQGFTTDISVDQGSTIHFKIKTPATKYHLDIYRLGYYNGDGARRVASNILPTAKLPQAQPACKTEPASGLVDCGNWSESASWSVPFNAVSGIYFAKLERDDQSSGYSHVIFVVRDDNGNSDLLFQTSDTTWHAYNRWGETGPFDGNSLYVGGPGTSPNRAYKVSYNRPMTTRGSNLEDAPFAAEYPMVRWLERNGYDVSYYTGVDTDRRGSSEIAEHKVFLSVGHDEYWSATQRANVEAARNAGVHLAFFSGNEMFWKTRWEKSIDGSGTSNRTLVSYKETHANARIDPTPGVWTGTWRDPRFKATTDGGKPENALTGTLFTVNDGTAAIEVPEAYGKMRLWRNTSVASLKAGETATLAGSTLGYEWDEDPDNGFRPPGLMRLSKTTTEVPEHLLDYGSNYAAGEATHHLTLYKASSGALVFGAGTVQWSWGLDGEHDRGGSTPDSRMQQATVNLFADMGVQPHTLQNDLVAAVKTTDTKAPTATFSSPASGADLESGKPATINGVASDPAGEVGGSRVAAVEVSTDGGATWHPAEGRETWTYKWTPQQTGAKSLRARAIDDSGNIGSAASRSVDVVPATCPCSIWDSSFTGPQDPDGSSTEVGLRFRADNAGFITALRFYKTSGNTGTHTGRLWTNGGTQLAVAKFVNETGSGWQEVSFDDPVAINANTTYVASYYAPNGHYAARSNFFDLVGVDSAPLHALASGVDGANGIFKQGGAGELFSGEGPQSFQAANYMVDVVFMETIPPDVTPPQVLSTVPAHGATELDIGASVTATFSEPLEATSINATTVSLRDPEGAVVPAALSYNSALRTVKLSPSDPLRYSTLYTLRVKGGAGGVTDRADNPLPSTVERSFSTVAAPPPAPDSGPGGPILVIANAANQFSQYYAEILRAEGLNAYKVTDLSSVTPSLLAAHDVAILGEATLSVAQEQMLETWVQGGGNLISMRPDPGLASLLGLAPAGGTLANAYLQVDTGTVPGKGIVGQTIQFHGSADRYTASGAQTIATLFSSAASATANPAVTLHSVGPNGGQAAAFSYDLAKSVIYTRQGNRAWAGDERDNAGPIRSDDLFFGNKAGDEQPDWIDLNKVQIPQADEQQRLLTNLIESMNVDRKPLPRFWFLPRDEKAAVIMTGDDHGNAGTIGRFQQYEELSSPGCVVANWECVRSTSYVYPATPIGGAQAAAFNAAGFEIGLHVLTDCEDWSSQAQLDSFYSEQLSSFATNFAGLPAPTTERTHCIVWSDWASQPKVQLANGIRLDTNYYYWPGSWVQNRPGLFTGSGMPMRFADHDGSTIDVYQAATQMTDESNQVYPFTANTLLDNALGPQGYYGVFTANIHTDVAKLSESDAIVASAQARGVPIVSARQMLTWLDGRNQSSFGSLAWAGNELSFTISPGPGANGLRAMLPVRSSVGDLVHLKLGGVPVSTTTQTIKGIEYAFFDAAAGSYTALYGAEPTAISPLSPANQNSPKISGIAPPGSTVRIYTTANCTGSPVVTTSATQFGEGVTVPVPDDSTTEFRVTATPSGGSPSPCSAAISYVEDSAAPQSQVDSGPTTPTASTTAEFAFSGNDGSGSGVASFQCRRDSSAEEDWVACVSAVKYLSLGDGSHKFEVRATDKAGNVDASPASFTWVVDTIAPVVTVDSVSKVLLGPGQTSEIQWHANENGAFELRVGGGDCAAGAVVDSGSYATQPAPHTSVLTEAALAEGANTLRLCLLDGASNRGSTTVVISKDTVAPTTAIGTTPPALSASALAEFTFSGNDGTGSGIASFECRRDGGAWAPCASPQAYASLGDGAHSFEVRALDKAGNADATPEKFDWSIDTTAPATTIDSGPAQFTAATGAEFTFSGNDGSGSGVVSFECRRDGETWATCNSSRTYADLLDGAHSLEVKAIDKAGNTDASPAKFDWTIDTTAPTTTIDSSPSALTASADAEFTFSGNDGSGSGVASFECRRDGGAWDICASPHSYTGLDDGSHTFEVRAVDQAGNAEAPPVAVTWTVDTAAPTTTLDSNPPTLSASADASFAFSGTDGSGSGVASFECRRDGGSWAGCTSPHAYAGLADGSHQFEVRAIDTAGNADPSPAIFDWAIDTTAPNTTIDSSPPALSASADANFAFSGNDGSGSGVASFECRRDNGAWATCSSPQAYTALDDGSHAFEVKAIDKAGNADVSPEKFEWMVDTTAPSTTITSNPPSLSDSTEAEFAFSGDDGAGSGITSFECRRDSTEAGDWEPCSSPKTYADLADGEHDFEVRAFDQAGNVDATPATISWAIDTTAPSTTIDSSPPVHSASADAEFTFSGADSSGSGVASFECRRDSTEAAAWEPCTSPKTYAGLADGSHAFEVRALDVGGNVDLSPATFTWSIDTAAPTTSIDSNPPPLSPSADAEFAFSGNDGSGSGVASFECRRDEGTWTACTSPQAYVSLSEGTHAFEVRAIDKAGNADASPADFTWTIDTAAPTTSIDASPPPLSPSADASFAFSGGDSGGSGVASFECRRDSGAWTGCTSPHAYAGLADGSHHFEVRAIDKAGNADTSPADFTWTIDTTGPTTTIDSNPSALSASADAEFAFSGSDGGGSGVSSIECRRDSSQAADWEPCTSTKSYASLIDGAHTFEVRAIDQAGNVDATPATFDWTIDTTAPTTIIGSNPLTLSASAAAEFIFSGDDGTGSGITSFECRRDSTEAGDWEPCSSPKTYADLADGEHDFEVRAIDQAGNVDVTPASFAWTVDTTMPTTAIDSNPPALTASADAEFAFSGDDGSGSGVASFQCRRDDGAWATCSSPQAYTALDDGSHAFEVRAIDKAGNADATPAKYEWTIDTTAPTTTIDSSPPALSASASAEFAFSAEDGAGSGVASIECRRDGGAWEVCTSPKTYASLADGAHGFEVKAIDQAGNADASPADFNWTIDTTAPTTSIDSNPSLLSPSAAAEFAFSGNDGSGSGVASFECRRDGEPWASCASPKSYTGLDDGTHSFEVKAIDEAGNADASPADFTWTIDTTAPTTTIDSSPPGASASAEAEFAFSADDGTGSGVVSIECRRDGGAWEVCASPKGYSGLGDGSHSFEVRAIDQAGNVDATPASSSWTVDTVAPTVTIDSISKVLLGIGQTSEIQWHANENGAFELRVGGSDCTTGVLLDAGSYGSTPSQRTSAVGAADLVEGANTLRLCLTDSASNRGSATTSLSKDTSAPTTTIDTHPDALTASASAEFTFSGGDSGGSGVASFQCRRDSTADADWQPCASPKSYASLADGSHAFQVRAIDAAGNADASPAAFSWTIDTTAPVVTIDSGPSGLTNDSTPTFAFHAGEPGSSFECSLDTGTPAYGPCSSAGAHTPSSPLTDGPYTFRVRATDAAGNQGTEIQAFTVDTAAPAAPELNALVPASPANENSPEIVGTAIAGSTVRLYATADCSGPPLATASAVQLADGIAVSVPDDSTTKFRATATSSAGNPSACSAALTYVEDSSAPQTQIDGNPVSLVNSALATFVFSGTDTGGSGVTSFQCRIDSAQAVDWEPCSSAKTYASLSDGSHSFEVRAIDAAGNTDGSPAAFNWTIDTTAPSTQIDTHPATLTASSTAEFGFSATDTGGSGVASFQCRLDSTQAADWQPCASPKSYTGLSDGAHAFEVRAVDHAGNADGSSATFGWTVDTAAPAAPQITASLPASPANHNSPKIVGSAADGSTVRLYEGADCTGVPIESASAAQLAAGITVSVPDDSTTRFSATATSSASNTSACSSAFTYVEDSGAPQTQIDAGPAALSTSPSAEFAFSASDLGGAGVASYECRIDSTQSANWSACTSPTAYGSLADGTHSFEVRAIDVAGNADGSPASLSWNVDTTPEQKPIGPDGETKEISSGSISIRLQQVKYNQRSGRALLVFKISAPGKLSVGLPEIPAPGSLSASGPGAAPKKPRKPRTATIDVTKAGLVRLPIKLGAVARQMLLEGRKVRIRLKVGFEALDESSLSRTMTIVLKRPETQARAKREGA